MVNKFGDVVSKLRFDVNYFGFVCFDLLKFLLDIFDMIGE